MHCTLEAVKVKYSINVKLKILKHVEKSRHLEDKQRFLKLSRYSPDVTHTSSKTVFTKIFASVYTFKHFLLR